jgi:hypothetical protein
MKISFLKKEIFKQFQRASALLRKKQRCQFLGNILDSI